MIHNHGVALNRDTRLENFAAELTNAVYPLALRQGMGGLWINVEVGLWREVAKTVKKWAPERPPVWAADEFKAWQEGLLVDLTETAFYIAVKHGIRGAFLEVELGLYQAFRSVIEDMSGC